MDPKKVKTIELLLFTLEKTTDYVETVDITKLSDNEVKDIEFCSMLLLAFVDKLKKGKSYGHSNA